MGADSREAARKAVNEYRAKLKAGKPPPFELKAGDLLVTKYGDKYLIVAEQENSFRDTVHVYNSKESGPQKFTVKSIERMFKRGDLTIYKGPKWSEEQGDDLE